MCLFQPFMEITLEGDYQIQKTNQITKIANESQVVKQNYF